MDEEPDVAEQVSRVLQERYRDTRYVEIETAEKIANRLMGWAKVFGFFAGIPLLLMTVWLGWLGYTSFQDVQTKLTKLQTVISALEKDVDKKRAQLAKLNELDAMEQQLAALSSRVKTLEAVKFSGAADVGEATRQRIKHTLGRYQARLAALGHRFDAQGEIGVRIEPSAEMQKLGTIALYRSDIKTMLVDEKYTAFDDVVLREYTHHILMGDARGFNAGLRTLESGLADYFSRSFEGAASYPSMPERTLANDFKIESADDPRVANTSGLAWGALAWDVRGKVGADAADRLLMDAWKLTSRGGFKPGDFGTALLAADQASHRGANAAAIRELLAKRGVSL